MDDFNQEHTGPIEPDNHDNPHDDHNDHQEEHTGPDEDVYLSPVESNPDAIPKSVTNGIDNPEPEKKIEFVEEKTGFWLLIPKNSPGVYAEKDEQYLKANVNGQQYGPYRVGTPVEVPESLYHAAPQYQYRR